MMFSLLNQQRVFVCICSFLRVYLFACVSVSAFSSGELAAIAGWNRLGCGLCKICFWLQQNQQRVDLKCSGKLEVPTCDFILNELLLQRVSLILLFVLEISLTSSLFWFGPFLLYFSFLFHDLFTKWTVRFMFFVGTSTRQRTAHYLIFPLILTHTREKFLFCV